MDTVDKTTRSRIMASIHTKDTKPELVLRKALHKRGFRYRLHDRRLPGSPDLVFPKYRALIFVHGCFWHRHEGCRFATMPSSNRQFWQEKFRANRERDRRKENALHEHGWRILVVWECVLKNNNADYFLSGIEKWLRSEEPRAEIP